MAPRNLKYEQLRDEYGSLEEHNTEMVTYSSRKGFMKRVLFISGVTLIALACLLAFGALSRSVVRSIHNVGQDCGSSVAEAKQRNCHFDIMGIAWVPSQCYNEEISEEYLAKGKGSFRWYSDGDAQNRVSLESMRLGHHKNIWTSNEFHSQHCAYVWRLQSLALSNQQPVTRSELDYNHTLHCIHHLFTHLPAQEPILGNQTVLKIGFERCRSV